MIPDRQNEPPERQVIPAQVTSSQPAPKKKTSLRKIIIISIAAAGISVVAVPTMFLLGATGILSINSFGLEREARANKNALDKIEIISGTRTNSSAEPNGDGLTGSSSPASAKFTVNKSLRDIRQEVSDNITRQGFILKDNLKSNSIPAAADAFDVVQPTGNTTVEGIAMLAGKGENALMIRYWLKEVIECSINPGISISEPCYFERPVTLSTSGLDELQVREVEVIYDDNKNLSYTY
jgi:hypothetical protein